MKLTHKNYYTKANRYLSHSKLKDYAADPWYFHQKHIAGEIEQEDSDVLLLGRMVDTYITRGVEAFLKEFTPVARRSKNSVTPTGVTEVPHGLYQEAVGMAESIVSQDAFKEMKGFDSQKILQVDEEVGAHFVGLCGVPDWIKLDKKKGVGYIRDLKTTKSINERDYHWSCVNYGYYSQAGYYQILVERMYGITDFVSEHLAVEKDGKYGYRVQTFKLNQARINSEKKWILHTIERIKREVFEPRNVSFKDAVEIGGLPPVSLTVPFNMDDGFVMTTT